MTRGWKIFWCLTGLIAYFAMIGILIAPKAANNSPGAQKIDFSKCVYKGKALTEAQFDKLYSAASETMLVDYEGTLHDRRSIKIDEWSEFPKNEGEYVKGRGKIFQIVNENAVLCTMDDLVCIVYSEGIGRNKAEGDRIEGDRIVVRKGTYKCTAGNGAEKVIPRMLCLEPIGRERFAFELSKGGLSFPAELERQVFGEGDKERQPDSKSPAR
jgi:hypothetical protein